MFGLKKSALNWPGSGLWISRMASTSVPLLLLLAVLEMGFAAGQLCRNNVSNFVFESFDCFKDRQLKCIGDCISTADGKLNLTRYDMRSWGRLMYAPGIRLMDPVTTRVAHFSTNFTFSMKGDYSRPGEGLAFVMQANPVYQGHSGGFLGLYSKDGKAGAPTVAIEFDTYRDWFYGFFMFNDINSNHVGVDIGSINSKIQVDAGSVGIELGKAPSVTAWIDYIPASENTDGNLQVRISTDTIRPLLPLLSYNVDLSKHISEIMYLGFSATTGDHLVTSDCLSYHNILSWSFHSWRPGPNSPPPAPPPPILPPPSVLPPIPLPPEPPTPTPPLPPPSPALPPPLTPDAPVPSPADVSPPAPAPFSSPSPSPSSSKTPTPSPPPPYPIFPPSPPLPPASPSDSPVPVPSPDTSIPPIPDVPAPSPALSPPPAISPSSPPPADDPSLPPESIPSPSAGPAPSSYVSPPAPLPPAPAPTSSGTPSPSTPSPNSTVSPSSEPPSPTPEPTSLPAPAPSTASGPVPAPPPGYLDATRAMAASIAGFTLLFIGYALVVYNRVLSELGDGSHSDRRVGYLGDQTMIGIWPATR